jgi:hypothetical protein
MHPSTCLKINNYFLGGGKKHYKNISKEPFLIARHCLGGRALMGLGQYQEEVSIVAAICLSSASK